jgi:hypothetical protein
LTEHKILTVIDDVSNPNSPEQQTRSPYELKTRVAGSLRVTNGRAALCGIHLHHAYRIFVSASDYDFNFTFAPTSAFVYQHG